MKKRGKSPRAVIVTRPTEYELLLGRHGTFGQVKFFVESRDQSLQGVLSRHERHREAVGRVVAAIPVEWRRTGVERRDLDRFLWDSDDIVVVVGQDGLVANVAKYLSSQPVIGINPIPGEYDGILVPHGIDEGIRRLEPASRGEIDVEDRCMVMAETDDGRRLVALNEIFVGHRTHQSARYKIARGQKEERQSSSGLVISTGTGSTGWARSIYRQRVCSMDLPDPCEQRLSFFVREAFPSQATQCDLTEGVLGRRESLSVTSRMDSDGVIFGDGIERDFIEFNWGRKVSLSVAKQTLRLVR